MVQYNPWMWKAVIAVGLCSLFVVFYVAVRATLLFLNLAAADRPPSKVRRSHVGPVEFAESDGRLYFRQNAHSAAFNVALGMVVGIFLAGFAALMIYGSQDIPASGDPSKKWLLLALGYGCCCPLGLVSAAVAVLMPWWVFAELRSFCCWCVLDPATGDFRRAGRCVGRLDEVTLSYRTGQSMWDKKKPVWYVRIVAGKFEVCFSEHADLDAFKCLVNRYGLYKSVDAVL